MANHSLNKVIALALSTIGERLLPFIMPFEVILKLKDLETFVSSPHIGAIFCFCTSSAGLHIF